MALSVRPAGGTTSVRPAGPLVVSRALASRPTGGGSATDLSLSYLARTALAAASGRSTTAGETFAEQALREARADLTRALASLCDPVRALAKFDIEELMRGSALLRTRVLRAASSAPRELGLLSMLPGRSEGLSSLVRGSGYASYPRSQPTLPPASDVSLRPYVLLSHSDRTLLSLLYVSAQTDGHDLQPVDDVARALLVLRQREQPASVPQLEASLSALYSPDPALSEPSAYPSLPPPEASAQELEAAAQAPWLARSDSFAPGAYGNASVLAARVADSYRSLMPPAPSTPSSPPSTPPHVDETEHAAQGSAPQDAAQPRALDVAEALGLRSLISTMSSKVQVARRRPQKRRLHAPELSVEARDRGVDPDAARDDRRRARWYELARRRRERLRAIFAR